MSWARRTLTRRELLELGGGAAIALALAGCGTGAKVGTGPFGELGPDPDGVIDLPAGFRYRVLSPEGSPLRGGLTVPGHPDGMGAFAGPGGTTVLVRNHELPVGGTSAVVLDRERRQLDAFRTSWGTRFNCGGGVTPWGTWLTCEEAIAPGHGYVYEVSWEDPESELSRRPIAAMGRFSHEAAAVDPATGVVYLTEDDKSKDAPTSFLYRYLPDDTGRPGALHAGGRLEALAATGAGAVSWLEVEPEQAHREARRGAATRFVRLEGCVLAAGVLWFADTSGGEASLGQIFRYTPAQERLELVLESRDAARLDRPDNLAMTPWGDLFAAEDGKGENRLMGITPAGETYVFARATDDELAGPCFSPDGATLFLNAYNKGLTLAIWGPFPAARTPDRS